MWRNNIKEIVRRKMRHDETGLKAEVKKISKYRKQLWGEGRVGKMIRFTEKEVMAKIHEYSRKSCITDKKLIYRVL